MSSKQSKACHGLPAGQKRLSFSAVPGPKRPKPTDPGGTGAPRPPPPLQQHRDASGSSFTRCPVCGAQVPLLCINLHLDAGCVDLQTTGAATAAGPSGARSRPPGPAGHGTELQQPQGRGQGLQAAGMDHPQQPQQPQQQQHQPQKVAGVAGGAAAEAPPQAPSEESTDRASHQTALRSGAPATESLLIVAADCGDGQAAPSDAGRSASPLRAAEAALALPPPPPICLADGDGSGAGGGGGAGSRSAQGQEPGLAAVPLHPMFLPRAAARESGGLKSGQSCGERTARRDEVAAAVHLGVLTGSGYEGNGGGGGGGGGAARGGASSSLVEGGGLRMLRPVPHPSLDGQYVVSEFVTPAEEAELLALCDDPVLQPPWSPWSGQTYANATAQRTRGKRWGVLPDYHRRGVAPLEHPLPPLLRLLAERMRARVGLLRRQSFHPNEANAIDYRASRGSWLRPHVDDRILSGDLIVNLCLAGAAVMSFGRDKDSKAAGGRAAAPAATDSSYRQLPPGQQQQQQQPLSRDEVRVLLPPRSLQVLSRAARYSYTHAIAPADLLDERRVSITFRRSELRAFEKPG
ncbi:hypothetical protein PLESTB_001368500 [Pleodorina starrii]|uniref:Fe2OG dioxygenase domain-containing protein n=1 Tax=Pleodorina starrii TaxID=330485 RepID=A0A9W6BVE3_9CHLO|nr:hypothetical protein PLESTB_001368500 [Pleodorina starrii]